MDSAWQSSIYFKHEWIQRVLEEYDDEVDAASTWAEKLVGSEVRNLVWNVCIACGVPALGGLPGHACLLLERYFATIVRESFTEDVDNEEWEQFKETLAGQIPLLVASCVQLATKMTSATMQVHPRVVRASLLQRGLDLALDDLIAMEFNVFRTIGFRVPLWTSEDVAQLMAVEVGFPESHMETVGLVINAAEYHRHIINERVCKMFSEISESEFSTEKLHTLHLVAGAVIASTRFLSIEDLDPSDRLSKLTRAPLQYIVLIRNIILTFILDCEPTGSISGNPSGSVTNSNTYSDTNGELESQDAFSDSDDDESLLDLMANKRFKF